ncbi:MAG: SapC family protein, partial [Betaproteobacteria bacterium]
AQKIGGFLIVSEAKLKALAADALKKLMAADALGLAYAQLFSMGNLGNLFAAPQAPAPAAKPRAKRSSKKTE